MVGAPDPVETPELGGLPTMVGARSLRQSDTVSLSLSLYEKGDAGNPVRQSAPNGRMTYTTAEILNAVLELHTAGFDPADYQRVQVQWTRQSNLAALNMPSGTEARRDRAAPFTLCNTSRPTWATEKCAFLRSPGTHTIGAKLRVRNDGGRWTTLAEFSGFEMVVSDPPVVQPPVGNYSTPPPEVDTTGRNMYLNIDQEPEDVEWLELTVKNSYDASDLGCPPGGCKGPFVDRSTSDRIAFCRTNGSYGQVLSTHLPYCGDDNSSDGRKEMTIEMGIRVKLNHRSAINRWDGCWKKRNGTHNLRSGAC